MAFTDSTLRSADALAAAGLIRPEELPAIEAVGRRYAIAIPPALLSLIGAPDDPIGRQFIPRADELVTAAHEHPDPIGDEALSPVKGIVHRYPDRALLKPILACPVYCRFCFRREQVGPDGGVLSEAELDAAFAWLAERPAISEVILTGGEPLALSARRVAGLMRRLAALPHVEIVRIHTRLPIADPERLDDGLAAALGAFPRAVWVVAHVNHARELTPSAVAALRRLQAAGTPVLAQSVLLRGVNDSVAALEGLFRALIAARVKPYYLHQLDPAPGTAHFHVPIDEGRALLAALRGRVSGLAWPTYVLDIPGGHGKVPIGPDYLGADGAIRDPAGITHKLAAPSWPE
jgi:lysine 2,3-aminomutase